MRRLLLALSLLLLTAAPAHASPVAGFGWPLAGSPTVERGFDPPRTTYGAGHRGVDLRGTAGQAVLSAGPGRVTYAGLLAGRGVVTVTHAGGLRTTYEPVSSLVHVGQAVERGSVLGRLASGHASCLPGTTCLHWGLLRGDTYLDPLGLVEAQQVRLLPVPASADAPRSRVIASAPLRVAARAQRWDGPARSVGAVTAAGALIAGVGLLVGRSGSPVGPGPGSYPPAPIDLRAERRRRRAA